MVRFLPLYLADDPDQFAEDLERGGRHHAHRVFRV
jgi:hypothetical protein